MHHGALTRLCFILSAPALADTLVGPTEPDNYCHDQEANARWAYELENAPEDTILIELFALRQGLCLMVDAGALSVDKATAIFERARRKGAMERRKEESDQPRDRGLRL